MTDISSVIFEGGMGLLTFLGNRVGKLIELDG